MMELPKSDQEIPGSPNRDPDSRFPAESGNGPIPDSRFPADRESEIPSPIPGQIGNRGGRELGTSGSDPNGTRPPLRGAGSHP